MLRKSSVNLNFLQCVVALNGHKWLELVNNLLNMLPSRIALYFLIGSLDFSQFIISDKFFKRYLEGVATGSFTMG